MDFLLLFVGEGAKLDKREVKRVLEGIPGVFGLEDKALVGAVLQAHFDFASDSTIVRLKDDGETISLSGTGDASLKLAFEIQAKLAAPLRMVDADYSLDIALQRVESLDELRRRVFTKGT